VASSGHVISPAVRYTAKDVYGQVACAASEVNVTATLQVEDDAAGLFGSRVAPHLRGSDGATFDRLTLIGDVGEEVTLLLTPDAEGWSPRSMEFHLVHSPPAPPPLPPLPLAPPSPTPPTPIPLEPPHPSPSPPPNAPPPLHPLPPPPPMHSLNTPLPPISNASHPPAAMPPAETSPAPPRPDLRPMDTAQVATSEAGLQHMSHMRVTLLCATVALMQGIVGPQCRQD
ncbi:hypothetical protein CYMTET_12921, partial [Cymbomonas tetramitiformis]